MKKNISVISLLLSVLFLVAGCENSSSDWVKYKTDKDGNVYSYSKGSMKVDSANNAVQVLAKEIYSDVGKTIELQSRIKDGLSVEEYGNLSSKTCLYEIDCTKRSIAVLAISHYDKDNKAIYAGGETKEKKWFEIQPDSTGDALQKAVCPGK
ncbi:MAG: hypothetical protein CVU62_08690 [Deltaproteobacteria bacterium HGW-Deltaproteobacteria-2]|jgi:hypothetical protein|nr:MAG: hypothetical protein CVU62_08690 [Deltaproteobacteria bacterium HGW-Deltaproteobacteria-2]